MEIEIYLPKGGPQIISFGSNDSSDSLNIAIKNSGYQLIGGRTT
jgi:hypothetical protein